MDDFNFGYRLLGFLVLFVVALMLIGIIENRIHIDCEQLDYSILKAINAIEDKDTGVFSSGSVDRDTLLFENGMVIDNPKYEEPLILGEYYKIIKCETLLSRETKYKIE